jgi:hypothetical protein
MGCKGKTDKDTYAGAEFCIRFEITMPSLTIYILTENRTVDVRAPNVPVPNFTGYRNNFSSIPTLDAFQLPTTINYTGTDAKVPVVYKVNVSYTHFFTDHLKWELLVMLL